MVLIRDAVRLLVSSLVYLNDATVGTSQSEPTKEFHIPISPIGCPSFSKAIT